MFLQWLEYDSEAKVCIARQVNKKSERRSRELVMSREISYKYDSRQDIRWPGHIPTINQDIFVITLRQDALCGGGNHDNQVYQ